MELITTIIQNIPYLIAVASAIAASTPTPKDDQIIGKLYKIVDLFAINFGYAKNK